MLRWLSTHYLYILRHQWVPIRWPLIKLVYSCLYSVTPFLCFLSAHFRKPNSWPVRTQLLFQVMVQIYCTCTVWGEPLSQTAQSFMPGLIHGANRSVAKVCVVALSQYHKWQELTLFQGSLSPPLIHFGFRSLFCAQFERGSFFLFGKGSFINWYSVH